VKDEFLQLLVEPRSLQRGYFKPAAVRSLVDEHLRGRRDRSSLLWRMLVLELWHRNFLRECTGWNDRTTSFGRAPEVTHAGPAGVEATSQ
jgi:hypothetical protein